MAAIHGGRSKSSKPWTTQAIVAVAIDPTIPRTKSHARSFGGAATECRPRAEATQPDPQRSPPHPSPPPPSRKRSARACE
jgi:hypothetical protein